MAQSVDIKISELRLDHDNPRIDVEDGQINIRQALLDDQGSKIGELAADIAKNGLNPMDRMMVLQSDPNKQEFIALEGNRRTCALQILANPSLMDDLEIPDALRNKLAALADDFEPTTVEPISGVVMPDRDAARRWIELRHTGQNSGRGIVDWNGVQTARFRGDKVLDLIEYVKAKGNLTAEEKNAVAANFPITTLDRIVSNPAVRQKLGIQITDGEYYLLYPEKVQAKVLKKIVLDLASKKIKVDTVKSKEQQIQYVDGLPNDAMPSGNKLASPASLSGILKAKPAPTPPPAPPPPSPLDRRYLIPKSFTLSLANQKAAQLLHELRTLNINHFPIAAAVTLRSFVEATCEIYCTENGLPSHHATGKNVGKPLSLNEKVEAILKNLGKTLTKQELTAARLALTSKDSVISVGRLHEYVHNPAVFPVKSDLVSEWSGIEVFFKAVCK